MMNVNVRKTAAGAILAMVMLFVLLITAVYVHPQPAEATGIPADSQETAGEALWEDRAMDVIFQMAIILAGAFGVLALIKGVKNRD